jgi:hypothetical protein
MTDHRNLFNRCLHLLRDFDDSRQRWSALHDPREEIVENPLDLAIDQVVDLKLVETVCLFQLPRAGPAHHYLWSILLNYRVGDDLQELMRVKGSQVFAENLGVN